MPAAVDSCHRGIRRRWPRRSRRSLRTRRSDWRSDARRARVSSSVSRWIGWSANTAISTTRRSPDMCGISGVFALNGPLDPDVRRALPLMNGALAHRGPDGDGFYDGPGVALGHRRLAIIDRAGGKQPMSNEDGTCWIVFNGEVYNHRSLRPLLEAKGHRFRTVSDTEVMLHAYEEFGPACVERFEGMFAFAIYDGRRQELFAARDRLGKKPFFYTVLSGVCHFASELPALGHSPLWHGDVDLTALEGYLSLGYFIAPSTIYRNVHKLMPGYWLRIADGK